jgi:hypothetical protein
LLRARAERYSIPVYGGDDPSLRDALLEAEEIRVWQEEREAAAAGWGGGFPDDDEEDAPPEGQPYRAKKTGDPLCDYWEQQLAAGEDPDLELR